MVKANGNFEKTNYKTRVAYGTGATECSPKCICNTCKLERKELSDKFGKHFEIIMKKMCELNNVDYYKVNFHNDEWYTAYTWTEEEEQVFRDWLFNYMKDNVEARKELMRINSKSKKNLEIFISEFCLMWSWSYK